jgi:hypothetical protein
MGTYNIPRNVKGEGRILYIFSTKGLIFTVAGVGIGVVLNFILSAIGIKMVGIIIMIVLGLLGFIIGTCKVPETNAFEITRKTGGENIDDIIIRAFKFYKNRRRIYIYKEEETKDEQ